MNAIEQARKAYAPSQSTLRTAKSIEYQAFTDVVSRLKMAASRQPADFAELAAAIHDNRSLWTILAADVADEGNSLPKPLRAQIFYLAEFTNHHSTKVLKGEASADILIEINTAVMRGLSGAVPAPASARGVN